jgi:hypothetical protein
MYIYIDSLYFEMPEVNSQSVSTMADMQMPGQRWTEWGDIQRTAQRWWAGAQIGLTDAHMLIENWTETVERWDQMTRTTSGRRPDSC